MAEIDAEINRGNRDSSILPEELASQSVRLKEEQLRREEEKVNGLLHVPDLRADIISFSCARSSFAFSARSTRRGRNFWRRKNRSGKFG